MAQPLLEDVFKRSGLPTYTFVEPAEYNHLKVALRTPGRGLVIEGPSGIGKTTAVRRAAADIGLGDRAQMLSGRNAGDRDVIAELPGMKDLGIVVIDDFHRLDDKTKHAIADFLKELADREDPKTKIVLIGINKAGDSLVSFAADLNNRIDTIPFEVNEVNKVRELIAKGEAALNITIDSADKLAEDSAGSFHIAQILCHEICLNEGITEKVDNKTKIETSIEVVKERVLSELSRAFLTRAIEFARGRRFRREGRAPYLHLLYWLRRSEEWTCSIDQILANNPKIRGSLGQVIDKGHLSDFLKENATQGIRHAMLIFPADQTRMFSLSKDLGFFATTSPADASFVTYVTCTVIGILPGSIIDIYIGVIGKSAGDTAQFAYLLAGLIATAALVVLITVKARGYLREAGIKV